MQSGGRAGVDRTGRAYRRELDAAKVEEQVIKMVRRVIHGIRNRVRDMRTLRKVLRVFELRDGKTQGDESHLYEDTVRILRVLSDPRPSHPEIFLRGDFAEGRNGIYFEYDGEAYDPQVQGRRFACALVEKLLKERSKYSRFDLFIEASTVQFPDAVSGRPVTSAVRQLRLIDLYERLLARALLSLKGKPRNVMTTKNRF